MLKLRAAFYGISAAAIGLYLVSSCAHAQKFSQLPGATGVEVYTFLDRTEQESETWDSNARMCLGWIPAREWPRVAVTTTTLALRWTAGAAGTRWGAEYQAQYSFDNSATWHSVSEMSYADVSRDWFFNSTDTGSFNIPAGVPVLVGVRLYYLGVPVWGRCNFTLSVHGVTQ